VKRLGSLLLCLWCFGLSAQEALPPKPVKYFNDYANVVPPDSARQLNERLASFERESSSQLLVAVFSKLPSASSLEDFTVRTANFWKVGQKEKNNGAVLFVFIQDRKLRIEVGYGLEGVLPDAICKRIIAETITPHFRKGNHAEGLAAGVEAMIAAAKGEYKGSGISSWIFILVLGVMILGFVLIAREVLRTLTRARAMLFSSQGARVFDNSSPWSWSSDGGNSSGGSGFSGGGGSFGGGGASGSW
jgi:uncharacterized protein